MSTKVDYISTSFETYFNKAIAGDVSGFIESFLPDLFNAKRTFSILVTRLMAFNLGIENSDKGDLKTLNTKINDAEEAKVKSAVELTMTDIGKIRAVTATNGAKFVNKPRTKKVVKDMYAHYSKAVGLIDKDMLGGSGDSDLLTWGRMSILFASTGAAAIKEKKSNPIAVTSFVPEELGITGFSSLVYFENPEIMRKAILVSRLHNINISKTLDRLKKEKIANSNADYDIRGYPYLMNGFNLSHYGKDFRKTLTDSMTVDGVSWKTVLENLTGDQEKEILKQIQNSDKITNVKVKKADK